jgi:hypothetical protein
LPKDRLGSIIVVVIVIIAVRSAGCRKQIAQVGQAPRDFFGIIVHIDVDAHFHFRRVSTFIIIRRRRGGGRRIAVVSSFFGGDERRGLGRRRWRRLPFRGGCGVEDGFDFRQSQ